MKKINKLSFISILLFATVTYASYLLTDGSVTTSKIANGAVTQAKKSSMAPSSSASAGQFMQSTSLSGGPYSFTSLTAIGTLSATITTTGRPVRIFLRGLPGGGSYVSLSGGTNPQVALDIYNGSTHLAQLTLNTTTTGITVPSSSFEWFDFPSAGTYTYTIYYQILSSGGTGMFLTNVVLCAYEL